jgi:osmotically-inducible protein OsmY
MDADIEEKVHQALWKDDVLRATDNNEIDIRVKNGIVYLSGHMISTTNRQRVEKALQTVDRILAIRTHLVLDDELTREVATSLSQLEHIHHCKFYTGVSHGVVVLNGEVESMEVRQSAEQSAANHPNVRGVINYIRVPGFDLDLSNQRFLQPPIGKEMYFLDGISGIIRQVVINPDNRMVTALILQGHFNDLQQKLTLSNNSLAQAEKQLLLIPMSVVGYLTKSSGSLTIKSTEFSMYQKFDSALFIAPTKDWVPPYPYCQDEVLFPVENKQAISEQIVANDSLGG